MDTSAKRQLRLLFEYILKHADESVFTMLLVELKILREYLQGKRSTPSPDGKRRQ